MKFSSGQYYVCLFLIADFVVEKLDNILLNGYERSIMMKNLQLPKWKRVVPKMWTGGVGRICGVSVTKMFLISEGKTAVNGTGADGSSTRLKLFSTSNGTVSACKTTFFITIKRLEAVFICVWNVGEYWICCCWEGWGHRRSQWVCCILLIDHEIVLRCTRNYFIISVHE